MDIYPCDLLLNLHLELGECPVWDDRTETLYWVDGFGKKWFSRDATGIHRQFETGSTIGSIALTRSGDLIAGLQNGVYRIDQNTGVHTLYVNPEEGKTGNRLNDGKVDPLGRFIVGSMSEAGNGGEGDFAPTGALYAIEGGARCRQLISNIRISNGLAWNHVHDTLYYIDSPTGCIFAFDYNVETGAVRNQRICVRLPPGEGIPDGMTIDVEDRLWVAHWGGSCVSCFDPVTGERAAKINLPVKHVTSCTFGGKNMNELYITTSTNGVSGLEWLNQPLAGALFVASVDVQGCRTFHFDG